MKNLPALDLTGQKFGRLKAIFPVHVVDRWFWACQCDCGSPLTMLKLTARLRNGGTRSCGCLQKEAAKKNVQATSAKNIKHGLSSTRLYIIFNGMKDRCYNPLSRRYSSYGGRGISICDEWLFDVRVFVKWALENGYSDRLTIDRIDPNGNYSPSNCRFADKVRQANNKTSNHLITWNNEIHTATEWARILRVAPEAVHNRLSRGWSIDRIMTQPFRKSLDRKIQ
jgi:hypothetical protein